MSQCFLTKKEGRFTTGVILVILGALFLLKNFFGISMAVMKYVWPTILILIGLSMIMRKGSQNE